MNLKDKGTACKPPFDKGCGISKGYCESGLAPYGFGFIE